MILAGMLLHAMLALPAVCPVEGSVSRCVWFEFEKPGAIVPIYFVVVQEDRVAYYWEGLEGYDAARAVKPALNVSDSTMKTIFAARYKNDACETKQKGIAQTGKKTLRSYEGHQEVECSYNYSDSEAVRDVTAVFMAIAETMQEGERLDHDRRFDRLGLDSEIDALVEEVKNGQAIEVQNIAPVLQSLIDDERVMDRVKRKAARLMADAGVTVRP